MLRFFVYLCGMKKDINQIKKVAELTASLVLIAFGIVLLSVGLWCPPLGQIDNSVLIAFGEIGTFSAALLGIDYARRRSLDDIKKEILNETNNKQHEED